MQPTRLETRSLQTDPELAALLPGGALRTGVAYSVAGSTALVMALLGAPSAAGAWCGVIGIPDFGVEAASQFGIDLERLVLVPHPGDQWLTVAAAVIDVLNIVVMKSPPRIAASDVARLSARLRQREATLIVLGDWPQVEAALRVAHTDWEGVGDGYGCLSGRYLTVSSTARGAGGRPCSAVLWVPDRPSQERAASWDASVPWEAEASLESYRPDGALSPMLVREAVG